MQIGVYVMVISTVTVIFNEFFKVIKARKQQDPQTTDGLGNRQEQQRKNKHIFSCRLKNDSGSAQTVNDRLYHIRGPAT